MPHTDWSGSERLVFALVVSILTYFIHMDDPLAAAGIMASFDSIGATGDVNDGRILPPHGNYRLCCRCAPKIVDKHDTPHFTKMTRLSYIDFTTRVTTQVLAPTPKVFKIFSICLCPCHLNLVLLRATSPLESVINPDGNRIVVVFLTQYSQCQ